MKIWYSVQNCGDGSAYPLFMESEAQAELDQEYMDEGWGESCTGFIEVESPSTKPITVKGITTIVAQIKNIESGLKHATGGWLKSKQEHIAKLEALQEKQA